MITALDWVYSY